MAIFETLSIVFKADSSQLKKEVDDVKKKTGEVNDTFKKSEDQTTKTDIAFSKLAVTLGKVSAGYFSIGAVISGFKSAFANTADIGNLSRNFGFDPQKLDAFSKVLKNLGYDAKTAVSELEAFASSRNSTPDAVMAYLGEYGRALRRDFKSVEQAQAFTRNNEGPGTTLTAALYNTEDYEELLAEKIASGVVSPEDIERQREFSKSLSLLADEFDRLFRALSVSVLPTLGLLVDALTGIVKIINAIVSPFNTAFGDLFDRFSDFKERVKKSGGSFLDPDNTFGALSKVIKNDPDIQKIKNSSIYKYFTTPQFQEWKDLGGDYQRDLENEKLLEEHQSFYIPTSIPSVTNSQASNLAFNGDVHINTSAQDAKGIAAGIVGELGNQGKALLAQLQQSNAYHDDGILI